MPMCVEVGVVLVSGIVCRNLLLSEILRLNPKHVPSPCQNHPLATHHIWHSSIRRSRHVSGGHMFSGSDVGHYKSVTINASASCSTPTTSAGIVVFFHLVHSLFSVHSFTCLLASWHKRAKWCLPISPTWRAVSQTIQSRTGWFPPTWLGHHGGFISSSASHFRGCQGR